MENNNDQIIYQTILNKQKDLKGQNVCFTIYINKFSVSELPNEQQNQQYQNFYYFDNWTRLGFILNEKSKIDQNSGHLANSIGFHIFKVEEETSEKQELSNQDGSHQNNTQSGLKNNITNLDKSDNPSLNSEKTNILSSNVSLLNYLNKDAIQFESNSNLNVANSLVVLYVQNQEQLDQIYKHLKNKLIMTNFHRQYRAIYKVGKGTFASVYLVANRDFRKQYAVKVFQKKIIQQEQDGLKGFFNEMNIMREVKHGNIINLHEVWESENSYYYVIDYMKHGSLLEKILMHRRVLMKINRKKDQVLKESEIKEYTKQILQALAECARKQIMHRDVKPENVLLLSKKSPDCVLSDFGLAQKIIPGEKYLYPKCGTPGYVAPEIMNLQTDQLKNANYSPKCDVFSVGCIMYFMYILEPPFGSKSQKQIIKNNKKCIINFVHSRFLNLSKNAQDILRKMLEKDPEKRPTAEQCLQHPYFEYDEFDDVDEQIPVDSPVNINNKKNRAVKFFNFNVSRINSQGMKLQKAQDQQQYKIVDSFKMPTFKQQQTSLIMARQKGYQTMYENDENYENQPSIEHLLEEPNNQNAHQSQNQLNDLYPKTANLLENMASSKTNTNTLSKNTSFIRDKRQSLQVDRIYKIKEVEEEENKRESGSSFTNFQKQQESLKFSKNIKVQQKQQQQNQHQNQQIQMKLKQNDKQYNQEEQLIKNLQPYSKN